MRILSNLVQFIIDLALDFKLHVDNLFIDGSLNTYFFNRSKKDLWLTI